MDQAGASNRITPEKIVASMRLVQTGRVYEIGQVYERGMPLGGTRDFALRLVPAIETALESWDTRIPTGQLNSWLTDLIAATPPPVRSGKQPKVLFATQAGTRPPTFVLFTTGFLEAGYRRFIERRLREDFGFAGSPVRISVRVREKRLKK